MSNPESVEPEDAAPKRSGALGCASAVVFVAILGAVTLGVLEERDVHVEGLAAEDVHARLLDLYEGHGDQPWMQWAGQVCRRADHELCEHALTAATALRDRRCDEAREHARIASIRTDDLEVVDPPVRRAFEWDLEHCGE
jgi:hypothetical protein